MATTNMTAADDAALQALVKALDALQAKARQLEQKLAGRDTSATNDARAAGDVSATLLKSLGQPAEASLGALFSGSGGNDDSFSRNASPFSTETAGNSGFDQKAFEITIDQMVAHSLLRGRETSGVLRTLFGLVPTLIGR